MVKGFTPLKVPIRTSFLHAEMTDAEFDEIYPLKMRRLAEKHFTPVQVAKTASAFLVGEPGAKVLDIGSGAGKFCIVGALNSNGHFTGIEQRLAMVDVSSRISESAGLKNVTFIQANVTSVDFRDYDAFYIYNSFYENIDVHDRIDDTVLVTPPLYSAYLMYTFEQLSRTKAGTRLATYYTLRDIVPPGFTLINSRHEGRLDLWERTK
jgi:SAM-dependent methyltransferase